MIRGGLLWETNFLRLFQKTCSRKCKSGEGKTEKTTIHQSEFPAATTAKGNFGFVQVFYAI